jgi:hypothetical protein
MATNNLNPFAGNPVPGVSKISAVEIPGFGPSQPTELDLSQYKVRYSKIDLDDPGSIAELEILETRAIRNEGIHILNKDKFVFMDKYFLIVSYLEQDRNANTSR